MKGIMELREMVGIAMWNSEDTNFRPEIFQGFSTKWLKVRVLPQWSKYLLGDGNTLQSLLSSK